MELPYIEVCYNFLEMLNLQYCDWCEKGVSGIIPGKEKQCSQSHERLKLKTLNIDACSMFGPTVSCRPIAGFLQK